jgi:hypothetical protein
MNTTAVAGSGNADARTVVPTSAKPNPATPLIAPATSAVTPNVTSSPAVTVVIPGGLAART